MIGYGAAIPEPEPFFCGHCRMEIMVTDEDVARARDGESLLCFECSAPAPLETLAGCDSCDGKACRCHRSSGYSNGIGDWTGCCACARCDGGCCRDTTVGRS